MQNERIEALGTVRRAKEILRRTDRQRGAYRHAGRLRRLLNRLHGGGLRFERHGRQHYRTDAELFEQERQRVVMIGVEVRDDDVIEPRDAARPEDAGDRLRAALGGAEASAIVEPRRTVAM